MSLVANDTKVFIINDNQVTLGEITTHWVRHDVLYRVAVFGPISSPDIHRKLPCLYVWLKRELIFLSPEEAEFCLSLKAV